MSISTAILAAAHFAVDMICAWAMAAYFIPSQYANILIYNFCAFALQMPFGALMDLFRSRSPRLPVLCAILGGLVTLAGAFSHPAILGVGNALFHVGGGIDIIEKDFANRRKGRDLGIFVAPGAIGLYLGSVFSKGETGIVPVLLCGAVMLLLLLLLRHQSAAVPFLAQPESSDTMSVATGMLCCFLVVVLRSWISLSVNFSWKSVPILAFFAVLLTASGKCCGGFLAARYGMARTAGISLILAAISYLASESWIFGLAAIFLFNMSMPLTLYLLVTKVPHLPGFCFGLLTFGLFLGFLPVYLELRLPISGSILGAGGSVLSCILLIIAGRTAEYDRIYT